jgi:hypothetical protein
MEYRVIELVTLSLAAGAGRVLIDQRFPKEALNNSVA